VWMAISQVHEEAFRRGSKTYYNSSRFFPPDVREDVFLLYGFVRTADNFVDSVPQDVEGFRGFTEAYRRAAGGVPAGDEIIDGFIDVASRRGFEPEWTDAFLRSMHMDTYKRVHRTIGETIEYIYGSAEVIGLYMARILGLARDADEPAKMLGRAMQMINFIRDVAEDTSLGRTYLPLDETTLPDLSEETARSNRDEFVRFLRLQLDRYRGWHMEGERGYRLIPRRYRVPIKTAADMYNWTARTIERDPFVVFDRKVKPAKARVVLAALGNVLGRMR
jgi:15-cis-phytoene synthase